MDAASVEKSYIFRRQEKHKTGARASRKNIVGGVEGTQSPNLRRNAVVYRVTQQLQVFRGIFETLRTRDDMT